MPDSFTSHIPRPGYFSQFGKLTRVRLSRNKKTGKAKHYAFLEFQHPDVARIVSDAMDGYFMFSQKLSCKLMRPEQSLTYLYPGGCRTAVGKTFCRSQELAPQIVHTVLLANFLAHLFPVLLARLLASFPPVRFMKPRVNFFPVLFAKHNENNAKQFIT
eukprot:649423-Pelagomonas_calceolata.AAC.2